MKSDELLILGIAGLTVIALLSRKAEAVTPQPHYVNDCENFERM